MNKRIEYALLGIFVSLFLWSGFNLGLELSLVKTMADTYSQGENIPYVYDEFKNSIIDSETDAEILNNSNLIMYIQNASFSEEIENSPLTERTKTFEKEARLYNDVISSKQAIYYENLRQARIRNEVLTRGIEGRFYCPAVGIDVALFRGASQAIVNARDSAAIFDFRGGTVIGDHNYQGFSAIRYMVPGSTICYISNGTTVTKYICIDKYTGYNTKRDLVSLNGESAPSKYPGSLVLYTCNDWSGRNITIVHIKPVQ